MIPIFLHTELVGQIEEKKPDKKRISEKVYDICIFSDIDSQNW